MPSGEEIMQQEFMNNCAVRTVISGVMGSALGLLFGVVMGSMDSAVGPAHPASKDHRSRTGAHCWVHQSRTPSHPAQAPEVHLLVHVMPVICR